MIALLPLLSQDIIRQYALINRIAFLSVCPPSRLPSTRSLAMHILALTQSTIAILTS